MIIEDSLTLACPRGEQTTVDLVHGDLTKIPPEWKVDLLLASAFPNNYDETRTSLIGALARNQGIRVYDLACDKQEDLRDTLECWVSKPLSESSPYRRIMIWEPGYGHNIVETVESIFAAIIATAPNTETLAMPILGAGDRGSSKGRMLEAILYAAQKWVRRGLPIKKISIFMYTREPRVLRWFQKTKIMIQAASAIPDPDTHDIMEATVVEPTTQQPTIVLSYANCDQDIADRVARAIALIDDTILVEKVSAKLDTNDITQKEATKRSLTARASKVIALLTPGYVRDIACRDHFNECYLSDDSAGLLEPIMVESAALPNYIQMIQCHDALPNCSMDKLFAALVSIVKSRASMAAHENQVTITAEMKCERSMDNRSQQAMSTSNPSYDVFISYSSRLRAQARATNEILEYLQKDIRCFFDANELHAGIRWQQRIYQSLDNTKIVLFVLTPEFAESTFCREEAAIASLLVREGRIEGIVAVEAIPLSPSAKLSLPKEVRGAIVVNETPFQACQRATGMLLGATSLAGMGQRRVTYIETRNTMHSIKEAEIEEATSRWETIRLSSTENFGSPKICIVGHDAHAGAMSVMCDYLNLSLSNGNNAVQLISGPGGDAVQTIDAADIIICVLSPQFLESSFFMNSLNTGLLRNRSEGGCLIPIHLEASNPDSVPTFVRLMPTIDASGLNFDKEPCSGAVSLLKRIAATSKLSRSGMWKPRTTIVALGDASQID